MFKRLIFCVGFVLVACAAFPRSVPAVNGTQSQALKAKSNALLDKIEQMDSPDDNSLDSYRALGPDALAILVARLDHPAGRPSEQTVNLCMAAERFKGAIKPHVLRWLTSSDGKLQVNGVIIAQGIAANLHSGNYDSTYDFIADSEIRAGLRKLINTPMFYGVFDALGSLKDKESFDLILPATDAREPEISSAAFRAVAMIADESQGVALEAILPKLVDRIMGAEEPDESKEFFLSDMFDAAAGVPVKGASMLAHLFADSRKAVREEAASALVWARPEATDVAVSLIDDPDTRVRTGAIYAVGKLGKWKFADKLIELSKSPDLDTRLAAIQGLSFAETADALSAICLNGTDSNAQVRQSVASALGAFDQAEAVALATKLAKDPDADVRTSAALSLDAQKKRAAKKG